MNITTTSSRSNSKSNGLGSTIILRLPRKGSSADSKNETPPAIRQIDAAAAELVEAVYPIVLRRAKVDQWVDLELELWKELSAALERIRQRSNRPETESVVGAKDAGPALERVVTYFGIDENGEPTFRRFLSFKIIAGPGPNKNSGLASIIPLAVSNTNDPSEPYHKFHTAKTGGAAAAMEIALHYLDAFYDGGRWQKVESNV